ncbi:ABC transporter ATP-binding protein [Halochromatium salexigens]|uniref:ABC transporter ATP-binding protein n=1 Tax=Halochromatium salexigens TaxID=49447 RepID=A0AAJ0UCT4_HALSE|nr:ABC transporter ATP-binding protein [Halochromatium salexigens]MBK5929171.1 ABC transporter ATP-binding protein [Halochromatium salexigens]
MDHDSRDQPPILAVTGLGKSYAEGRQRRTVLADIDFAVASGECVALVGQSGSGKSTLLNLLAGIDKPDTGDVEIMGRSVAAMGEPELTLLRRAHIGFIYQFFNLIPTLTVAENIGLPLELNGRPARERRTLVGDWLAKVGLDGREEAFPDELSGGEQQRVAIARALIHDPALVLADEPTGNLDARTGQVVLELLAHLFRDEGRTLILVTHSRKVSEITDRLLALDNGRLSTATEVLSW